MLFRTIFMTFMFIVLGEVCQHGNIKRCNYAICRAYMYAIVIVLLY